MMWNFLEQRSFAADYWARVRYVAKMVGRTFLFPMLLIVNFNNNKGIASFKVAEGLTAFDGSEPHSILGSVSLSHRLWIPGLIVGEDLTDWEHLNWEEEPLNTELHPKALVLPEYDMSDVKLTLHSPSKELSLETSPERKQVLVRFMKDKYPVLQPFLWKTHSPYGLLIHRRLETRFRLPWPK